MPYAREPISAYLGAAVVLSLLPASWVATQGWLSAVLCGLVLVFGLPHGAYDVFLLRERYQRGQALGAAALYVIAALGVTAIWWFSPTAFLLAFLILSVIHFGDSDWPDANWLTKLCWGTLVLAVPAAAQPAEVIALLTNLAPAPVAALCVQSLTVALIPAAVGLLGQRDALGLRCVVLLLLALVCLRTSALIGFAVYFCLFHARTHLARWRRRLPVQDTRLADLGVLAVLVVVTAAGIVYALNKPLLALDAGAVTITFIALASLTAPHMITVAAANRDRRMRSDNVKDVQHSTQE